ncbi:P-loop NTPase fold protein [Psychrobacter sp. B38]|uniref:P-loop NTPase fold protein n=1 Tax=Psychrobacter sp. B38 TaxID=3143538 RepID=UPI00320C244A
MANVESLEKRLADLIDKESSFAIALTGEWGIGKTHFWKEFYHKKHKDLGVSKYSYVSLFGVDSIDALKFEIALSTHATTQKKDYLTGLKGIFKKGLDAIDLPKLEGTGVTLSLGKGLISSAITSLIGDTLICIDDIERLSKNLDIKDVMGLVNHLSLEKNCKVVVILHEGKADKKFREYKEKVFDEILILNDSLSMVKETVNDDEIFPIYEEFYQTMGVRNLRFYQRVQKIYQEIIKHSSSLSKLSKEEILRQILIIKLVNDIPKVLDVDMRELETYFSEDGLDDRLDIFLKSDDEALKATVRTKKDDVEEKLSKFYPNFRMEGWTEVVIELITNIDIDSEKFERLLNQDLINEKSLESDREKRDLMTEYHSLSPENGFNQRLFDNVTRRIDIDKEDLNNLSFHCNILRKNGAIDLANQLQEQIEMYISSKVLESSEFWHKHQWYSHRVESHDIFYDYLVQVVKDRQLEIKQTNDMDLICEAFKRFYKSGYHSEELFEAMRDIQEDDLSAVLWQPIDDERDRKQYIRKTLQHPAFRFRKIVQTIFTNGVSLSDENWILVTSNYRKNILPTPYKPSIIILKSEEVRRWTLKLLKKRVTDNPNSKAAIENWLEYSNNLKNLNS